MRNTKQNENNPIIKIVIFLIIIIVFISLYFLFINLGEKDARNTRALNVSEMIKIRFNLLDHNNNEFTEYNLKGNSLSLIYFGFTACPDICPNSLEKMVTIANKLKTKGVKITPIFVTVDPTRDTPKVLKEYLSNFSSNNFIGLSGSEKDIKTVTKNFGIFYEKIPNKEDPDNYMINHSTFMYLIDNNGEYITHFNFTHTIKEIIDTITKLRYKHNR